jgi:capsular exopolysaccharide synthesis family protein
MAASPIPGTTVFEEAASTLTSALKVLGKHWVTMVACVIFAAGIALVYSKSQPRIYEATTMLEINPRADQPLGQKDDGSSLNIGAGIYWDTREYYETEYKIMTSDKVLRTVVRDLGLANDPGFVGLKALPSIAIPEEDLVDNLRGRLMVDPVKNSRLVLLHVDDTDPKRAARISDAVANAFIDQNLRNAVAATSEAVDWLKGQLDHVKGDLDKNENALHEFKQENNLPSTSINETSNMLRLEMQDLDTALTHTRTKREELSARHAELQKVLENDPDKLPASELLASAYLQSLRLQYQDAVKEHDALLAEGKLDNHPSVKRASEHMAATKGALLAEVKNIKDAVERDLAIVTRQEGGERSLFEESRKQAVDLNMKEIEYHRLDRSREQNEKMFELLLSRMKEAEVAAMMRVNNIRVVDTATEPKAPIRPRTMVNLGVGVLAGLLLGVALGWGREQLDNSLKTPDDLEQRLNVTFLGLLPEMAEDGEGKGGYGYNRRKRRRPAKPNELSPELIVHEQPLSGIAEAARSIRTNLMFMNPDRPYRKLLVSSAAPSEGKTTVACSIAIAFAQGGQKVCIVDCDLRRPRIHRIFDRAGDAGVTNVIVGNATVDEVVKPTIVANLWSVPAGPTPPNPADMLHSERFKKFLADLADRFDRVVIDSPPVVPVTDSAIISTLVDGTVFVVRAFSTTRHLGHQGLRTLRDVDSPVVGAVLNAVNLSKREYNYYYQYYYHRDGYRPLTPKADEEEPPPSDPSQPATPPH